MQATSANWPLTAEAIAAAQEFLDQGKTLPYSMNGGPEIHKLDQEAIFKPSWQAVCALSSVAEPGSTFRFSLSGVPVVLVRGHDGVLRGFVNACRHRGYPVVCNDGWANRMTCRYHGWTYNLDGGLLNSPGMRGNALTDERSLSLISVAVAQWRGCVFANLDCNAPPLGEAFKDLDSIAAACDFDLSEFRWIRRLDLDIHADWKLVYDNVVECYHCPSMHAQTLNTLYEASNFDDFEWRGHIRKVEARLKGSERLHHTIQLFPGTYLVMDPAIGIVGRFFPVEPSRTRLEFHFLAPPDGRAGEAEHFAEMWARTLREDGEILEAQAPGVNAGALAHGYLVEGPETSVIGVQHIVLEAYRRVLKCQSTGDGTCDAAVA